MHPIFPIRELISAMESIDVFFLPVHRNPHSHTTPNPTPNSPPPALLSPLCTTPDNTLPSPSPSTPSNHPTTTTSTAAAPKAKPKIHHFPPHLPVKTLSKIFEAHLDQAYGPSNGEVGKKGGRKYYACPFSASVPPAAALPMPRGFVRGGEGKVNVEQKKHMGKAERNMVTAQQAPLPSYSTALKQAVTAANRVAAQIVQQRTEAIVASTSTTTEHVTATERSIAEMRAKVQVQQGYTAAMTSAAAPSPPTVPTRSNLTIQQLLGYSGVEE
ncbi:MAG: hypothetical protein Q9218_007669 [Villophora microphyllina]